MPTIKELRRENDRLRNVQKGIADMQRIQSERLRLAKENQKLKRSIKFEKSFGLAKSVGRATRQVGKSTGKAALKTGKGAFRGLVRYGRYLEAQERKQKSVNRKLKSVKKKVKKRTKKRK